MKLALIIAAIVVVLRIDDVLRLIDKTKANLFPEPTTVIDEIRPATEVVSVTDDKIIQQTPKIRFINMLENFARTPDSTIHQKAMDELKANPTMFTDKLDPALEAAVYSWRDVLVQNSNVLPLFLLDLMKNLRGENKDMVMRFFSLMLDHNPALFFTHYGKSGDINCLIVQMMDETVADEDKQNLLFDREKILNEFVSAEKVDPVQKRLAETCLMKLRSSVGEAEGTTVPSTPAQAPAEAAPVQTAPVTPQTPTPPAEATQP